MSKKKKAKKNFDPSQIRFSVIKQRGSPTEAMTMDGNKVYKQDSVVCQNPLNPDPESLQDPIMIKCIDYHDDHFVYLDPVNKKGSWFAWCTCGSPAVIIYGSSAYSGMTNSMMLACFFHAQFGHHVTSETNKRFTG